MAVGGQAVTWGEEATIPTGPKDINTCLSSELPVAQTPGTES